MSLNSTPPTPPSPPPPPHRRPLRLSPIRYYRPYWCYQCHQTVTILSLPNSDIFCPRCNGQFLQEIEFTRPRLVLDLSGIDRSPTSQLIEALSVGLGPQIWRQPTDLGHRRIHPLPEVDPETLRGFRIILRTNGPTITPLEENPVPPPRANINDYFAGPGLHELIEELTQNDRPGPPPAPPSAIEAVPRVKITSTHMINEFTILVLFVAMSCLLPSLLILELMMRIIGGRTAGGGGTPSPCYGLFVPRQVGLMATGILQMVAAQELGFTDVGSFESNLCQLHVCNVSGGRSFGLMLMTFNISTPHLAEMAVQILPQLVPWEVGTETTMFSFCNTHCS
ncbi:hypothetical protein MRB53_033737 [Persea americana]|uniref:Uncharacterized protein n=1 Tax=Persea americana TaxID=3435 RepID=A0ACC2KVU8_PERAE|nr:hypothetical protein MRB53_033737 [Persea americana]